MPNQKTIQRAKKKAREGKAPSTQAGEFVREEIDHIRKGKHGARSTKQAIAIGLSKARRAGVALPVQGERSHDEKIGTTQRRRKQIGPSARRSRAITGALQREPRSTVSPQALATQGRQAARRKGPEARQRAAVKAVRTKGQKVWGRESRKAAKTRKVR